MVVIVAAVVAASCSRIRCQVTIATFSTAIATTVTAKQTVKAPTTPRATRFYFTADVNYNCPEAEPFLACPADAAADAPDSSSAAQARGGRACADKELVLSEPITATIERLSRVFCAGGVARRRTDDLASRGKDVGHSFAGQMLDTLDADNSKDVSCTEWGIAKMQTTLDQLIASGARGYFGPDKVDPPSCKMSREGAAKLAKYNAYLAKLTLATAASNTTAWIQHTARGAALAVEGRVMSNAAVGAATAAKEGLLTAWNRTVSSSG